MVDWFDNHHEPRDIWKRIMGGNLGLGCGVVDYGNSLYFSGDGTREAVTVPLNTIHLRWVGFCVLESKILGHFDFGIVKGDKYKNLTLPTVIF